MQHISRLIKNRVNTRGGSAMKSMQPVLVIAVALLLVAPAVVLGAGEGRYQAITIFRGSAPMVFILDTKNGNSWLWQKGFYTNEAGIREEWSSISYQGRMATASDGKAGDLISAPRWRLPESQ
jgi:hypothetical protein